MAPSTQEANCFLVAQISEVPEKQTGLHKSQMHLSLLSQGPLALPEVSEATTNKQTNKQTKQKSPGACENYN